MRLVLSVLFLALSANAEISSETPLSIQNYLKQVKEQNPEARSLQENITRAELRLEESEVSLSSEFYIANVISDDQNEATNPFSPQRVKNTGWRAGIRDKSKFGLTTDFYLDSAHISMPGFSPPFPGFYTDYIDSKLGVEITQSLWRNSFGQATRADLEVQRSLSRIELLKQKFELKNLFLNAENTYWSLAAYNQIVKLQEENYDRAKRLLDWMMGRENLRLMDDVDSLQAQASLESRELELMSSKDERAALSRQFNSFLGLKSDEVSELIDLPDTEMLTRVKREANQRMTREDFKIIVEQSILSRQSAKSATSKIAPQLDLVAGVAANGLDNNRSTSYKEAQNFDNPTMTVGLRFSVPLDYSLIGNMKRSYLAETRSADFRAEMARLNEDRSWSDLLKQFKEVQNRFEKAKRLEKIQTELVKRERLRLLNGRTTTFQAINFEQNLALIQIQRIRSQLSLLQIHNLLNTFEVQQ